MPKRNLLVLFLVAAISLVACLAREQGRRVRGIAEVLGAIERSYLKPVDPRELETAAIEGIVARLDDQSRVIEGVERRDLEATLGQEFGGVGLELVAAGGGGAAVHAAIVGGPAWRAGIVAGDRIVEIDGIDARAMSVRDTVALLRGDVGSRVAIVVRGPAVGPGVDGGPAEEERSVTLVREEVRSESVLGDRRRPDGAWDWFVEGESGVALVRITSFGERTAEELDAALTAIASHGEARGLVIDLRGNPGGLLSAAVDACDRFLDEGVIVSTRRRRVGQDDMTDVRRATAGAVLPSLPLAVLVDGLTASAAEIMAACLQDHGRAVVVGSRSFGKGTVQSLIPLSDGRRLLKLTTAEYLRPADTERQSEGAWGVAPDPGLEIDTTAQAREAYSQWRRRRDAARPEAAEPPQGSAGDLPRRMDPVLAKALDSLPPRAVDFRRKEKTSGDADEAGRAGAVAGRRDGGAG